jgi:glutamine amidotransferase
MGNLRSVHKAFEYLGRAAVITSDPERVQAADHVVLPGVGAFADAMRALRESGMVSAIGEAVRRGKPLLGICLGMQLFFDESEEDGRHAGLGLLPGRVRRITGTRKVPHMGWNSLTLRPSPLFEGLSGSPYVYFVHSYYAEPDDPEMVIASAWYGLDLCAAVERGRVFATQFHPEKSGRIGLRMLKNFGELT